MTNVYNELEKRGFLDQLSDNNLKKILAKKVNCYVGFDPTSDSLHLGNFVGIMALYWFKKYGHKVYSLIGGATGRIGDPSGKSVERPFLDDNEILKNVFSIKSFFHNLLGKDVTVINNNDWFKDMSFVDFLRDIGKHFRMGPMLAKESVKLRMQSEEGMSFTEFSYQILQAYDFYYLFKANNISLQMGGSDQWGNIIAGIELVRKLSRKTVYGMTFPLLTRSDGKKFGKSEKGAIWLNENKLSYFDFYQYFISIPDKDVIKMLKMLTILSLEEISEIEDQMQKSSYVPNTAQKKLAEQVTKFIHGKNGLDAALKVTQASAPGADACLDFSTLKNVEDQMSCKHLNFNDVIGKKYSEIACQIHLVTSKSEATRLIKNNGAYLNNRKILDINYVISKNDLIQSTYIVFGAGKKKKILVKIKKSN